MPAPPAANPLYTTVSSGEHVSAPQRTYTSVCVAAAAAQEAVDGSAVQSPVSRHTEVVGPVCLKPASHVKVQVEPYATPFVQLTDPSAIVLTEGHTMSARGWAHTAHETSAYCVYPSNPLSAFSCLNSTGESRLAWALSLLSLSANTQPAPLPPVQCADVSPPAAAKFAAQLVVPSVAVPVHSTSASASRSTHTNSPRCVLCGPAMMYPVYSVLQPVGHTELPGCISTARAPVDWQTAHGTSSSCTFHSFHRPLLFVSYCSRNTRPPAVFAAVLNDEASYCGDPCIHK